MTQIFDLSKATLVVSRPLRRNYAFTLRKTKLDDTSLGEAQSDAMHYAIDYKMHVQKLCSKGPELKELEFETTAGLHCHGIFIIPEGFNFKLLRVRGWHLQIEEIYDELGWIRYIRKDKKE